MRDFNDVYEAIYRENAEPMEEIRKKVRNNILIVCGVIVLVVVILSICFPMELGVFIMVAVFLILIYIMLSRTKNRVEYSHIFKEKVIRPFVKEYSQNLEFIPNEGIDRQTYGEGEFERYDLYYSEDLIAGTLESGNKIRMAEVHTEDESTDEDGNTTRSTIFHGLFAKVELDKFVDSNIKIRKNKIVLLKRNEKIEMDSGEFEKKFNVFATDKIIAMQLLTADVMQMFLDFREKYKITPEVTLKQNALYIRFATGGIFEASIFKKALDYDLLKKYYDTINFTLDITEKILKNIKETEI